ncbi:M15 family metallopeptidase [Planococcus shenhongbingii]|uniref:D-alanyl-D-alanine carboxypeptidase family protein n=1 Tax=Planococcus shenhongbingii TaxID=3058398 RepID=A0ABT8NF88_9BACL|nr:D-alanyl-D-alanine carboxypeptidase family protein [Planococcus sp. N017]MDN7246568.1 D-alanyl-D-alanine carboxypeptidase family protein [Planococcus sp. N017]
MQSRYSPNQKNKKPYIKWTIIGVLALLLIAAASWLYAHDWDAERATRAVNPSENQQTKVPETQPAKPEEKSGKPEDKAEDPAKPEVSTAPPEEAPAKTAPEKPKTEKPAAGEKTDATQYPDTLALPKEPTVINNILLANKQHPLPETYAPGEVKEARTAFEAMRADALKAGIDLTAFSTYRDFARQKVLYAGYVAKDGQEAADRYSARPGFSEHQTGLAFDIGESGQEQHWASASFGATKGGEWLMKNAHKYGFILRYPKGAEKITGYMHESWHYRFVGQKAATEIYSKGITLEEYLGVN